MKSSQIIAVLTELLARKQVVSWADICAEVSALGAVSDWSQVRNALQYFINTGCIVRSADITVEEYIVL